FALPLGTQMFHVEHSSAPVGRLGHDHQPATKTLNKRVSGGPAQGVGEVWRDIRTARTAEPEDVTSRTEECLQSEECPRLGSNGSDREQIEPLMQLRPSQQLLETGCFNFSVGDIQMA